MIISKSIGNVLRVAGVQCALRIALEAFRKDKIIDTEDLRIQLIDKERAIVIVKYSVECLISLIDSTSTACQSNSVKRPSEMPDSEVIDSEFLQTHKNKIQKLSQLESQSVPFSTITGNHLHPQTGGKANSEDATKFLRGL